MKESKNAVNLILSEASKNPKIYRFILNEAKDWGYLSN